MKVLLIIFLYCIFQQSYSLKNGLAKIPPMGWTTSWQRYRYNADCDNYPDDCIRSSLITKMARILAEDWASAGYNHLIIDDAWQAAARSANGELQADPDRFSTGIGDLAQFAGNLTLKLGISTEYSNKTCGGFPGSVTHLETDSITFNSWGVDLVKLGGCNSNSDTLESAQTSLATWLDSSRPILLFCASPAYNGPTNTNFSAVISACNIWQSNLTVTDNFNDVRNTVDWYIENQDILIPYNGPGYWNYLGPLVIGNFGLSLDQSIFQMTVWALIPSPLMVTADLENIKSNFSRILLNSDIISVNQDVLGIPGRRILRQNHSIDLWVRPILPIVDGSYSYAVGVTNNEDTGFPRMTEIYLQNLTIPQVSGGYRVKEIFGNLSVSHVDTTTKIVLRINPTGAVAFTLTPEAEFNAEMFED